MGLSTLAQISSSKPVIFAEGFFISCFLQNEKFVPEEGIKKRDILTILTGEFFNRGADFVEDFTLRCKLHELPRSDNEYELEQFPLEVQHKYILSPEDMKLNFDPLEAEDGIALMHIALDGEASVRELETRRKFEKQVIWTMDEGDDFVNTEIFTKIDEALVLLDVLKQYNVPSVISFLAKRGEPIAVTYSKIQIGLDCLLFCLFQG